MAWTNKTVNDSYRMAVYTESDLTLPGDQGATEVSAETEKLTTPLPINDKFLVEVDVTETSAGNGGVDMHVQASFDGDSWFSATTTSSQSIDTTTSGKTQFWVNLDGKDAPFYRLRFFTDGTDLQDSATFDAKVAFRNPTIYRQ